MYELVMTVTGGNLSTWRKEIPSATSSTPNPIRTGLNLNPCLVYFF